MINKIILLGNLGRDPEVKHFDGNSSVAKVTIATNENYKDKNGEWQKQTEWHNVVMWNALAQRAEQYLKKGSLVYIEGKLTHRKYQDKDGNDKYITEVVARTLRMLDKRENSGGSFGSSMPTAADAPKAEATAPATPQNTTPPATNTAASTENVAESADDDLPF